MTIVYICMFVGILIWLMSSDSSQVFTSQQNPRGYTFNMPHSLAINMCTPGQPALMHFRFIQTPELCTIQLLYANFLFVVNGIFSTILFSFCIHLYLVGALSLWNYLCWFKRAATI